LWLGGDNIAEKKIYNNKNGNMSVERFLQLLYSGEILEFRKRHKVSEDPCYPIEMIDSNQQCFRCEDCYRHCMKQVKEKKDHYVVKRKKYYFKDLVKEEVNEDK